MCIVNVVRSSWYTRACETFRRWFTTFVPFCFVFSDQFIAKKNQANVIVLLVVSVIRIYPASRSDTAVRIGGWKRGCQLTSFLATSSALALTFAYPLTCEGLDRFDLTWWLVVSWKPAVFSIWEKFPISLAFYWISLFVWLLTLLVVMLQREEAQERKSENSEKWMWWWWERVPN